MGFALEMLWIVFFSFFIIWMGINFINIYQEQEELKLEQVDYICESRGYRGEAKIESSWFPYIETEVYCGNILLED